MNRYQAGPWLALALMLFMPGAVAAPVGTGFSYQGELRVSGTPANAEFDFEFVLFNIDTGGAAIATVARSNVPVSAGLFTTELDFTDVPFAAAEQYWLEVRVREGASTGLFEPLLPRQKITPAPYAVNARTVQAGGVNQGAIVTGAVGTTQLGNLVVTDAKIANASISGVKLANATITDAKIANATITAAKLAFTPGDVTAVKAGTGLVGGGEAGDLELTIDNDAIQARITGACPIGEYFRGVNANGTVACEPVPGVPRITVVDDPSNQVGRYTAIAIGSDGLPVVAYCDFTALSIKVAKCANAACTGIATVTTIDDTASDFCQDTSIAIGLDGNPVISYQDKTAFALKVAKCTNAACTGAAIITTVDDPANNVGASNAIAVGSDGRPVIAYHDDTADTLKLAKCASPACTGAATITVVDDPANLVGDHASIAIGDDDLPVIAYRDANATSLKVAKCVDEACTGAATITTVDDPANNVGSFTSIAIGAEGFPVVAYYDATALSLKAARCINAECTGAATITTVDDPATQVGFFTSIAIGADGLPVIGYWDPANVALKVAKCTNAACTGTANITTVDDSTFGVGNFLSLALGKDGLPVISYFAAAGSALKVAKCGSRSCQ